MKETTQNYQENNEKTANQEVEITLEEALADKRKTYIEIDLVELETQNESILRRYILLNEDDLLHNQVVCVLKEALERLNMDIMLSIVSPNAIRCNNVVEILCHGQSNYVCKELLAEIILDIYKFAAVYYGQMAEEENENSAKFENKKALDGSAIRRYDISTDRYYQSGYDFKKDDVKDMMYN